MGVHLKSQGILFTTNDRGQINKFAKINEVEEAIENLGAVMLAENLSAEEENEYIRTIENHVDEANANTQILHSANFDVRIMNDFDDVLIQELNQDLNQHDEINVDIELDLSEEDLRDNLDPFTQPPQEEAPKAPSVEDIFKNHLREEKENSSSVKTEDSDHHENEIDIDDLEKEYEKIFDNFDEDMTLSENDLNPDQAQNNQDERIADNVDALPVVSQKEHYQYAEMFDQIDQNINVILPDRNGDNKSAVRELLMAILSTMAIKIDIIKDYSNIPQKYQDSEEEVSPSLIYDTIEQAKKNPIFPDNPKASLENWLETLSEQDLVENEYIPEARQNRIKNVFEKYTRFNQQSGTDILGDIGQIQDAIKNMMEDHQAPESSKIPEIDVFVDTSDKPREDSPEEAEISKTNLSLEPVDESTDLQKELLESIENLASGDAEAHEHFVEEENSIQQYMREHDETAKMTEESTEEPVELNEDSNQDDINSLRLRISERERELENLKQSLKKKENDVSKARSIQELIYLFQEEVDSSNYREKSTDLIDKIQDIIS